MKICSAQTKPVKGDIERNISNHKKIIHLAVANGANTIIFPELSLSGYEPELAKQIATNQDDKRLDDFQQISDTNRLNIGVGMPTTSHNGTCISMIYFQPHKARQTYSKKYLHADEEEFFVSGQSTTCLLGASNIALAICYELSIPEHSQNAFKNGAKIYFASVAKSVDGVYKAALSLSGIAKAYSMTVLMANSVGQASGFECAGKSSIWNNQGLLVGELNTMDEGIIIIDTVTQDIFVSTL